MLSIRAHTILLKDLLEICVLREQYFVPFPLIDIFTTYVTMIMNHCLLSSVTQTSES